MRTYISNIHILIVQFGFCFSEIWKIYFVVKFSNICVAVVENQSFDYSVYSHLYLFFDVFTKFKYGHHFELGRQHVAAAIVIAFILKACCTISPSSTIPESQRFGKKLIDFLQMQQGRREAMLSLDFIFGIKIED